MSKNKNDPVDLLRSVHETRRPNRTLISVWLSGLDSKKMSRWFEYVSAFNSMPDVNIPDLITAVRSDDILGDGFPRISAESLKKWIDRYYVEEEKRKG